MRRGTWSSKRAWELVLSDDLVARLRGLVILRARAAAAGMLLGALTMGLLFAVLAVCNAH